LRIEQLESDEADWVIGITEILNTKNLSQKELLELASSFSGESLTVQLLNGLLIADEIHVLSAAQNALNAQLGGYMLSRSLDVEIIVFASTQRQIGRALDALGVYDGLNDIAVVVVGIDSDSVEKTIRDLSARIGKEVIPAFSASSERIKRIMDHYNISSKEINAIAESDKIESQIAALSRCLVSRVSLVAFDS
jgi:tRNA threonylcarbamoyladenosine modification (KEOPS) complex Cgi121 subunit